VAKNKKNDSFLWKATAIFWAVFFVFVASVAVFFKLVAMPQPDAASS